MDTTDFDFDLPDYLIAQTPLPDRAGARMLVLDRSTQTWEDRRFRDLPGFLRAGDCLVLNDSRVFPSRIYTDQGLEVFLLQPVSADGKTWETLVRPGKKVRAGDRLRFEAGVEAEVMERGEFGKRILRFDTDRDVYDFAEQLGHVPLPPYIKRADTPEDQERYQTVFAKRTGSVAAPTAGLHFTPEILDECRRAGADIVYVTLHVGLGTFQPVRGERLHTERFDMPEESRLRIESAQRAVCVGTTSVRSVESMMLGKTEETDLFIRPGFKFRRTGAILTNFHLPQSSLLMLVCAFGGKDFVLEAYRRAVRHRYRFYSYGDCMLLV